VGILADHFGMIDPRQYSVVEKHIASSLNFAFHVIGIGSGVFEDRIQSRECQVSGTDCRGIDVSCGKIQEMAALLAEKISSFRLGDGGKIL